MKNNAHANHTPYHGVIVPMITPVTPTGQLDEPAVRRVIDYLIDGGVSGIFILGTTGEAASVPAAMKMRLAAITIEQAAGRAQVYTGISHNCLAVSIEAAEAFFEYGADVCVAHLPSYYDLDATEQEAYYTTLSRRIPGPLMLYNIPSTTHMSIPLEVVARLSTQPNIVGLKDSQNDLPRLERAVELLGGRPDFSILVGTTSLLAPAFKLGVHGSVPSLGNLAPALCQNMYAAAQDGDMDLLETCQEQLNELSHFLRGSLPLGKALAAHKAAMGALSLCGPAMLPPLQPLAESHQEQLRQAFSTWIASLQHIPA